MDDGGTGLKKFKIDPFLTGSAVGLFVVVDSGAFFASSVTSFSGAVSVPLGAGSEATASADTLRFLVFGSFSGSSRMLRLPYVRNGLTRDRGTDGAGLAHILGVCASINYHTVRHQTEFVLLSRGDARKQATPQCRIKCRRSRKGYIQFM